MNEWMNEWTSGWVSEWVNERTNEWMNEWMKSRGWEDINRRGFLQYIFNMWTVGSDISLQRRHWQPLSVHLLAYCTHPTHDVNDVMC